MLRFGLMYLRPLVKNPLRQVNLSAWMCWRTCYDAKAIALMERKRLEKEQLRKMEIWETVKPFPFGAVQTLCGFIFSYFRLNLRMHLLHVEFVYNIIPFIIFKNSYDSFRLTGNTLVLIFSGLPKCMCNKQAEELGQPSTSSVLRSSLPCSTCMYVQATWSLPFFWTSWEQNWFPQMLSLGKFAKFINSRESKVKWCALSLALKLVSHHGQMASVLCSENQWRRLYFRSSDSSHILALPWGELRQKLEKLWLLLTLSVPDSAQAMPSCQRHKTASNCSCFQLSPGMLHQLGTAAPSVFQF